MRNTSGESLAAGAGIGAVIIAAGAALSGWRDQVGSANAALVLVLLVVIAASIGGRSAGAVSAVVASLTFNFFFTKPYLTVRVDSFRDMMTVVLVLAVGLAVGQLGVARNRQSYTRRSHLRAVRALEEIGAMVNHGATAEEAWPATKQALVQLLTLRDATFRAGSAERTLPVIEHDGRVDTPSKHYVGNGFALPAEGASLLVEAEGQLLGRIDLTPDPSVGTTREQRRAAAALADQFAIAARRSPDARSLA
jgi:K+-sensing histidine kinase KdpD